MCQRSVIRSRNLLMISGFVAVLSLAAGLAALADSPGTLAAGSPDHLTIRLRDVDDTGVSGKATFRADGGVTTVGIRLRGAVEVYPAHLHKGTCDQFEAMPDFPLADADPRRTTRTVLDVPLGDLLAGNYVINIHQPAMDLDSLLDPASVVACGEVVVPSASNTGTGGAESSELIQPPVTGVGSAIPDGSFGVLSVALGALAITLAAAGFAVRQLDRRSMSPFAT
jgi:hypothetical protein